MKAPRVLIVATEFPPGPGGIGTHAWESARWLKKYGWDVRVRTCQDYVTREESGAFQQEAGFEIRGLCGVKMPGVRLPYLLCGSWVDVSSWRPDVILATGRNAVLAARAAGQGRARLAAVAHGTEILARGMRGKLTLRAFRSADLVVAVSGFTAERLTEGGVARERMAVVPNGADEDVFHPASEETVLAIRREMGLGTGPAILTVGNVTERKGQWVVARALGEVARQIPDVEYWLVGLPTERKRVENEALEAGVADRVRFLGRLPQAELVKAMQACDVFAMTSVMTAGGDYEGFGIAVLEAALCGKPAVVSDCGGLPEAVKEGETGLVVREKDRSATARALIRLLQDNAMRHEMGKRARARALKEGTWRARMGEYDRLLRGLAGVPA